MQVASNRGCERWPEDCLLPQSVWSAAGIYLLVLKLPTSPHQGSSPRRGERGQTGHARIHPYGGDSRESHVVFFSDDCNISRPENVPTDTREGRRRTFLRGSERWSGREGGGVRGGEGAERRRE